MIGIGLGGFMDGYQQGQKIRDNKEDRARQKVLDQRRDEEYDRAKVQRGEIDKITADARTTFDGKVAAGEAKPEEFDTFFNTHTVPMLRNTYLTQGKVAEADALQTWSEKAETKQGARLFGSAISKAQRGDASGAMSDMLQLSKNKGYLDHTYEVLGHENIMVDNKLAGYRIKMKDAEGKEISQDILPGDLPKMIAQFANPEEAWKSQLAAQSAEAKRQQDIADYRAKKGIDREMGTGDTKQRGEAVKSLRERMNGGLDGKGENFDKLTREKQEELINQELELVTGGQQQSIGLGGATASAPAGGQAAPQSAQRNVVMDRTTGQPVSAKPPEAAPAKERQAPPATAGRWDGPAPAEGQSPDARLAQILQAADTAVKDGRDPAEIGQLLSNYGIPEEQWPAAVRAAYGRGGGGPAIGLGQ